MALVHNQNDIALDLMSFAKQIGDGEWEKQLKRRLEVLSGRRHKLRSKRMSGGPS